MITRRAGLAVRAVTALTSARSRRKANDLAQELQTTPGFVAHVLNPLVKAGWVRSVPGPAGGYELTAAADGLSALDVVEAVDGPTASGDCVLEDRACLATEACVLHEAWLAARAVLTRTLEITPAAICDPRVLTSTTQSRKTEPRRTKP